MNTLLNNGQSHFNTIVYLQTNNGDYKTYNLDTKQVVHMNELPRNKNRFFVTKPFTGDEDGLIAFGERLILDREELKNYLVPGSNTKYDAFQSRFKKRNGKFAHFYKTSENIAINFFKRHSSFVACNESFEPVTIEEFEISNKCYNAGVYYGEDMITEGYSYDFRMFYPSLLAEPDFLFPTKIGSWIDFDTLPQKASELQYGYYKCRINIRNRELLKIFMFSKGHIYTHYDLETAMKLKKRNPADVDILPMGRAYVYDSNCLVSGEDIFATWYQVLKKMKTQFPKNLIVKMLSSSLWGYLSARNTFKIYERDIDDSYDLVCDIDCINDKTTHVIMDIQDKKNPDYNDYTLLSVGASPQKYNFRLKSFITSYARLKMLKVLYCRLDDVVRINTDGFITRNEFNKKYKTLIFEGKNKYHIKNAQKVIKLD